MYEKYKNYVIHGSPFVFYLTSSSQPEILRFAYRYLINLHYLAIDFFYLCVLKFSFIFRISEYGHSNLIKSSIWMLGVYRSVSSISLYCYSQSQYATPNQFVDPRNEFDNRNVRRVIFRYNIGK